MDPSPARVHWAVAIAALWGTVTGSLVAASIALPSGGPTPVLGGAAAIFVGSFLGAAVGAATGAVPAFVLGRWGSPRAGTIVGAVAGLALGGAMGLTAEGVAQYWIRTYSADPLAGALVAGGIAGALVGIATAAVLRILRRSGTPVRRLVQFAGVVGGLAGAFAGIGGAGIGAGLAQSSMVCPDGASCVSGVLAGSLLAGLWIGALMGAIGAMVTAEILGLLPPPRPLDTSAE